MTKSRGIYNKWTTESFCAKVEEVTPGRWNFDKTVYVNFQTDMIVTCPKHGDVIARPQTLLKGVEFLPSQLYRMTNSGAF